jgi:hypothetical protein
MKRVSAKLFFAVLWKGVCQVIGWFFGLFGYKKEGLFAWCLWRLFASGVAVVVGIFAVMLVCAFCDHIYVKYYKHTNCYDPDCGCSEYLGQNIYYHDRGKGQSYVFNSLTQEKTIKNLYWIARPEGTDSLVCFSDGSKRGYFNMNTGEVVIPARYDHAWTFSEGLASVDEGGSIKFIDTTGKMVIDNVAPYKPDMEGLFFHGGYCMIDNEGPELCCLIDKSGWTVLQEFSYIAHSNNYELWKVNKGKEQGVYDKNMNLIVPMTEASIHIYDDEICMTMPDHTMRKYDVKGHLIHDFYIVSVRDLEFEKPEIVNRPPSTHVASDEIIETIDENYRPKAIARLRAYTAGNNYDGLMTRDGHIVTKPQYEYIEAIGDDLYLCTVSNEDKVVLNGKGEIVK